MRNKILFIVLLFAAISFNAKAQLYFGNQITIVENEARGARFVCSADFNGDNKVDILLASPEDDKIALYENNGDGNFGLEQIILDSINCPTEVHAVDLDNDGDMDILYSANLDYEIGWIKNDGNGNFEQKQVLSDAVIGAFSVKAADIDGDGDLDVICAGYSQNIVGWFENEGSCNFSAIKIITSSALHTLCVHAADLDGDNDIDLISSSEVNKKITWYENDGNGNFGSPQIITSNYTSNAYFYVADIDGDNDIDVIGETKSTQGLSWYANDGNANFTEHIISTSNGAPWAVHADDVDNDGDMDVVSAFSNNNSIVLYKNGGNGNFENGLTITEYSWGCISLNSNDLDGDGDKDLLSASYMDNKLAWYENDGNGNFGAQKVITLTIAAVSSVYCADLDGDKNLDILSGSAWDSKIAWYENTGNGNFGKQQVISDSAFYASCVYAANLNEDTLMDVLSASTYDDKIAWYQNNGNGNFSNQKIISDNFDGANCVCATYVDSDTKLDVVASSHNNISWFRNYGNGNFGARQFVTNNVLGLNSISTADMDGDGDIDILSASYQDKKIAWYENDGNGNFGAQKIIAYLTNAKYVYAVDLNNDGRKDVLAGNDAFSVTEEDKLVWYENLGNGTFSSQKIIERQYKWRIISIHYSDFNNDGNIDIIINTNLSYFSRYQFNWYENDGLGNFTEHAQLVDSDHSANTIYPADIDGDTDIDIISGSFSYEKVAWFKNIDLGFLTHPKDLTSCLNSESEFVVTTKDADSCRWQVNIGEGFLNLEDDSLITGANTNNLKIIHTTENMDNNQYRCIIYNCIGSLVSDTACLKVNHPSYETEVITACNSHTWIDGITYTASTDSATYTLTNAVGCDSIINLELTINYLNASITITDSSLISNSIGSSYKWLDCNNENSELEGETGQSYTPIVSGNYAVEISNNLCVDTSECVEFIIVAITENEFIKNIQLYPNPVSNELIIEKVGNDKKLEFEIINAIGQIVFKGNFIEKTTVQTSNFTPGVYIIKLENGKIFEFKKIIKE